MSTLTWNCALCTLENNSNKKHCAVCGTRRQIFLMNGQEKNKDKGSEMVITCPEANKQQLASMPSDEATASMLPWNFDQCIVEIEHSQEQCQVYSTQSPSTMADYLAKVAKLVKVNISKYSLKEQLLYASMATDEAILKPSTETALKRTRSNASVQIPDVQHTQKAKKPKKAQEAKQDKEYKKAIKEKKAKEAKENKEFKKAIKETKAKEAKKAKQAKKAITSKKAKHNSDIPTEFWKESMKDVSQLLWLPTAANSIDLGATRLNVRPDYMKDHRTRFCVTETAQPEHEKKQVTITSEFISKHWPRTDTGEPLPTVEVDGGGHLKVPRTAAQITKASQDLGKPIKTAKIKLHPRNKKDCKQLGTVMDAARWTYNECVRTFNDPTEHEKRDAITVGDKGKKIAWKQYLCNNIVNNGSQAVTKNPWLLKTGHNIREYAAIEFETARKGCNTKMQNETIKQFKMQFRSKKTCKSESIYVRRLWISQERNTIVLRLPNMKPMKLWTGMNAWHGDISMDCRLQRTWANEYYLCVPHLFEPPSSTIKSSTDPVLLLNNTDQQQTDPKQGIEEEKRVGMEIDSTSLKVCALDPGVRTFQTVFDVNEGHALQVGDQDIQWITRQCISIDSLISKQAKEKNSKRRSKIKRVIRRLQKRIKSVVDEVHKQLAVYLASNYDLVMIPKFEVSQMTIKEDRKIKSKTARQMLTWGHYRFRQRLSFKCRQYGCKLAVVNEAYTSMTCSCCGTIKKNLGSAKIYKCQNCGVVMDRDVNGAKNIFLRNYGALEMLVTNTVA